MLVECYEVRLRPITHDFTDVSTPGIQRNRRQARRPRHIACQVKRQYAEFQCSQQPSGSEET